MNTISTSHVKDIIIPRPADMHKGQAGRVLIIAGSRGMAGAAVLSARGALYSGAGLVKIAVPADLFTILQISVPEAMCLDRAGLAETPAKSLADHDVIVLGPGLGVSEDNMKLIYKVLTEFRGPVVIDADGINTICRFRETDLIPQRQAPTILTPHPGEAGRLLDAIGEKSYKKLGRENTAKTIGSCLKAIVLLKGAGTLIADGTKSDGTKAEPEVYYNPTGNPGMATGGSGDVLSGMIAALIAQKHLTAETIDRVKAAAFLHGIAGDIAAENVGEYGMTSADIADAVSVAFKEISE